MAYTYTTQRQLRSAFNKTWPWRCAYQPALVNDKPAKREAFNNWIDALARNSHISEALAQRATLER